MKKKIAILGSTGSIGKTTLDIVKKNKKDFQIILLSTNKNISKIIKQSREFNVKNIIVNNNYYFQKLKNKNIYNNKLLIEDRSFIAKSINDFFLFNLNQNTLLNHIENKIIHHE